MERTNQIIYIMVMNICISNTVVEADYSENTLKENFYIGEGVLTLGPPLLISLMNISIQTWILQ